MPIYHDIACPACGCVCDDLQVAVDGERIVRVEGGCDVARDWFLRHNDSAGPLAEIEGREVSLADAVERAAELLAGAKYPLITGLAHSSTPGWRAAIALADRLGATIDPAAGPAHAAPLLAMQQVGMSTATLGEIRERADLVVFWNVDPATTHPRLIERFVNAPGRFVAGGRADRTLIAIDAAPTATTKLADEFVPLSPSDALCTLAHMRQALRDETTDNAATALVERMKSCRTGVVFFSFAMLPAGEAVHASAALLLLVRELNKHARFYARPLSTLNLTGVENVLAWQTGFAQGVNFSAGWPRFSPSDFSAQALLARGEADVCLWVGGDEAALESRAAQAHLAKIPTIVLEHGPRRTTRRASVRIATATYGVHRGGTAYRMDDVPLPLRAILPTKLPCDDEVLRQILERIAPRGC